MASRPSGWAVGWALFAAVMLLVVGVFQALAGLVGIIEDDFVVVGPEYTYEFSVTAWGWAHLILGIVLVLAGLGIFTGNVLARTVGVGLAALSAIANFAWLPYQPFWSIVMIAVAVSVIWALTVHGRDITEY
jgi:hypothetical protein